MIIPPYLKKGDSLYLLAPSGYISIDKIQNCINKLKFWGFNVFLSTQIEKQHHYFAGTDQERLIDLQQALDNPNIQGIFCLRGGYGLSRIIDDIDFSKFVKFPKWIIGFSDITLLQSHIYTNFKIVSLHAHMANGFNVASANQLQYFYEVLTGQATVYKVHTHHNNQNGKGEGTLIGGNLSLITHLIGTNSEINPKNTILFLEDVGEYLYNIDRMLIQLKRARFFKNLQGLIFGGFTELKDTKIPFGKDINTILHEHFKNASYPICYDFPISHGHENYPVKIGYPYTLSVTPNHTILTSL